MSKLFIFITSLFLLLKPSLSQNTELATPTPQQIEWHDCEIGMFIHFAPNTWQNSQKDLLTTLPEEIFPKKLDTDQWVRVAVDMGAKYIVFVAKHVGGFCMWQTNTTDYSIKNTPWKDGNGDVLADLAESCKKHNIKLGVYLSPQDRKHGAAVGGRCKTPKEQQAYNKLYRQQLTEVLSRYGEMFEVWFDGSNIVPVGDILEKYAPNAIVFQGPHANIRWVGNEHGFAPYPAWNSVPKKDAETGTATARHGHPDGTVWMPLECDARIRAHWFWTTENAHTLKSVQELIDMYYRSVGHGAVLLLNQTPDTTGLIPEQDAKRAAEFYNEIKRRLGNSLAETKGEGKTFELDLGKPTRIDHIITMEDIRYGERIRRYIIEGFINDQWGSIAHGLSVGHKKIDRFDPLTVSKVRIRITESAAEPRIRKFAVYAHQSISASSAQPQQQDNIIYRWNMTNISTEWTPVKIDLKQYSEQAGQYKLIFQKTGGPNELIVKDVRLLESGVPLEYMVEKESDYTYFINITAVAAEYELEIICRQSARPGSMGHIELLSDFK